MHFSLAKSEGFEVYQVRARDYVGLSSHEGSNKDKEIIVICTRWDQNSRILEYLQSVNCKSKIYCEKPLITRFSNAISSGEPFFRNVKILYDRRFYGTSQYLKELVLKGPRLQWQIEVNFNDDWEEKKERFNFKDQFDYLYIYFCHVLDFLIYIFGKIEIFKKNYDDSSLDFKNGHYFNMKGNNVNINLFIDSKSEKKTLINLISSQGDKIYMNGFEKLKHIMPNGEEINIKSDIFSGVKEAWRAINYSKDYQMSNVSDDLIINNLIIQIIEGIKND